VSRKINLCPKLNHIACPTSTLWLQADLQSQSTFHEPPAMNVTLRRASWPVAVALFALANAVVAQEDSGDQAAHGRADRALPVRAPAARRKDDEKLGERLREGTRISDVTGTFQFAGDRVAFHPDDNRSLDGHGGPAGKGPAGRTVPTSSQVASKGDKAESFRVLENLALERINRELGQARGTLQWTVSGIVTEYRGNNYLLVTKAVVKSAENGQ
jgi:hypothetical protein